MHEHQNILDVIQTYFDGLYRGDPARLREVFHPDASVIDNAGGAFRKRDAAAYIEGVARRQSPRDAGEAFDMRVLAVEVLGDIASASAQVAMPGHRYRNVLSLLRQDGRWSIVGKLFADA